MSAAELRLQAFKDHLRALNALVHAVARFKGTVDEPSYPPWESSPDSFEMNRETLLTLEESNALGLEWQNHASKLDDALSEVGFDDLRDELTGLQELAERAREALLAINAYEAPYPSRA
jgi:hypothetical protein